MEALLRHLVEPIVSQSDAVQVRAVEGDSVTMLELIVHDDDRDHVRGPEGKTLRAIRTVLSAAAGRRKATVDLVTAFSPVGEE